MGLLVLHVAATAVWVSLIGLKLGSDASFDGAGWGVVRVLAILCSFVAGIGELHLEPTHLSSWAVRGSIGVLLLLILVDHSAHTDDCAPWLRRGWLVLPATLAVFYFSCLLL